MNCIKVRFVIGLLLLSPLPCAAAEDCEFARVACRSASGYGIGLDTDLFPKPALIAPYVGVGEDVDRNAQNLRETFSRSPTLAFDRWLVSVSGGMFHDRRGADSSEWDYSVQLRDLGQVSDDPSIDPGSYNYMVTGMIVWNSALRELGFSPEVRDSISHFILTAGSAAYQVKSDLVGENRNLNNAFNALGMAHLNGTPEAGFAMFASALMRNRTWYYEDVEDVEALEMGFRHAQLRDLQSLSDRFGGSIDVLDLGLREDWPENRYKLLDESFGSLDSSRFEQLSLDQDPFWESNEFDR